MDKTERDLTGVINCPDCGDPFASPRCCAACMEATALLYHDCPCGCPAHGWRKVGYDRRMETRAGHPWVYEACCEECRGE